MKTFIGIDPGASGGIAWICGDSAWAIPMPATETDIWNRIDEQVQPYHVSDYFAVIERVHSMPKQGVVSTFKFGWSYGGLRMALIAASIAFEEVTPQKWQKAMGCLTKGDKNVSKRKAQQLFPEIKITHAISEALLLAEYARRIRTQGKEV